MSGRPDGPSPALLAAQRRLEDKRRKVQQSATGCRRLTVGGERSVDGHQRPGASAGGRALPSPSPASDFPPANNGQHPTIGAPPLAQALPSTAEESTVRLHPDLALGLLGQGLAASGRIWLLLRHLDQDGRGWVPLSEAQEALCARGSDLRVCGRRQLRNLLGQGQRIFWQRDENRLWLKSAGRVAAALGVERLRGRPVAVPVAILLGGIGQVRAHFYATFHSGRPRPKKETTGSPINRATLEKITHVPARTQRLYEKRAGVERQANMAVGERLTQKHLQERAWQHGRAAFVFIDQEGKQGPAGGRYVAWRLPNSYAGPHATCPRGRTKKINRQIDLVNSRVQGNDLGRADARRSVEQLFHPNGQSAGQAYNREQGRDTYWPAERRRAGQQRLWRVLPANKAANDG